MKKIKDFLIRRMWKGKLTVQLGVLILVTNLLFLSICFVFQYVSIKSILQSNYEEAAIQRFEQADSNISTFCDQVDIVSRRISADLNLRALSNVTNMPFNEQIAYYQAVKGTFVEEMNNYSYIQSICYYGDEGLLLSYGATGNKRSSLYIDEEKKDWFYSSGIYENMVKNNLQVEWFGGYSSGDFGYNAEEAEYYITAVRMVLAASGYLVINVDKEYFTDLFYAQKREESENIFLIDEQSKIVAAQEDELIGQVREFTNGETIRKGITRYWENTEEGLVQVVVYELPELGWSLVSEISVKEVTRESAYLRNILLLSFVLSLAASFGFSMRWIGGLLKPLKKLTDAVRRVGTGELGSTLENPSENEVGVLTTEFNRMSLELEDMFQRIQLMEEEKRDFELQALRSQLNPHLIYNTLNTIKWMAIISNERNIVDSLTLFADFLEPVFEEHSPMCSIGEEIDYVKKYIAIMNLRAAGGYILDVDVPEEYYQYSIARFLLQPIVENAILHGLEDRDGGVIHISMETDAGDGYLSIEDDGDGIEEEELLRIRGELEMPVPKKEKRVGVANVNRRIKAQYGEGYGLTISNGYKGAKITLKIRLERYME